MSGFNCTTCGQHHDDLPMCLGSPAPAAWYAIPAAERETRTLLSSDQCIIDDEHFFLLGQLEIPVLNSSERFTWLTWVSVSEANFNRASELWNHPGRESEAPYFAWIQSALPYTSDTLALKGMLQTQPLGERPQIHVEQTEHPLSVEQRNGITVARVQELVELSLHGPAT